MNERLVFVLVEACVIKVFLALPNLPNLADWIISRLNYSAGGAFVFPSSSFFWWHGSRATR